MSKYSDDLEKQLRDIKSVRSATADVIKKGGDLAFKEYHDAKSVEKIKKILKSY